MREKKFRQRHLKLIKGRSQSSPGGILQKGKRPVYYLLSFLAFFLLVQILGGWIWATTRQNDIIATVLAEQSTVPVTLTVAGLITFEEEIILAPRPGFVYYNVQEGERVPVGKGLAKITDFPLEGVVKEQTEKEQTEKGVTNYLSSFKEWLLDEKTEDYSHLFSRNEELRVTAPSAGVVSLEIDGLEKFGPNSNFLYLSEEEFKENIVEERCLGSGERVSRYMPLLRMINNYRWYYSVVLPPSDRDLVVDETNVQLCFAFAPGMQVWGEQVEVKERDDSSVEITWCIEQYLENLYTSRWVEAEILYDVLEGMLIPRSAFLEIDGEKGVYIVEEGLVKFKEVAILYERDEELLVENLDLHHRVVAEPSEVKEGQRFYW